MLGDGVNDPDEVALMGNFHVVNASAHESWITVGGMDAPQRLPRRRVAGTHSLVGAQSTAAVVIVIAVSFAPIFSGQKRDRGHIAVTDHP